MPATMSHIWTARLRPWLLLLMLLCSPWPAVAAMRSGQVARLRRETVDMFYHGFDNYMNIAFPEDELRPVTCTPLTRDAHNPRNIALNDVLGNYSLTLIDSLSTLAILASAPPEDGNTGQKALSDFQTGIAALVEQYGNGRPGPSGRGLRGRGFDVDSKVQVFETVIRGVGGLLSAHLFAIGELPITGYNPGRVDGDDLELHPISWPNGFKYDGQLLRLALDLAQRLLPAFYTKTGMPYPRVNLRHGIPFYINSPLHDTSPIGGADGPAEITETCTAGAGSLVLEFTVLSRLTGDPRFEQAAKRAFWAVWDRRSVIGLLGTGVDAEDGRWVGGHSVVGAGADSFFEYALKTHILLSGHQLPNRTVPRRESEHGWLDPNTLYVPLSDKANSADSFLEVWHQAHAAIKRHLYTEAHHPHYENVNLWTGSLASQWVDSLGAYYSGLLALAGEVEEAIETNLLYAAIWTKYSAIPERWSVHYKDVEGGLGWWPLRPEFIESTYHLYRATKDPFYLYIGEMVLRDITRRCWTPCGWAGLQNVLDGEKSDRMESFFLGETAKYMYLLFDDKHPLNSLDAAYVFTTEGHPLIIPKSQARTGRSRATPASQDVDVYFDKSFTNTCPVPFEPPPLTGSVITSRTDFFHPARLLDLHQPLRLSGRDPNSVPGPVAVQADHSFFPWTLPNSMLPEDGICSRIFVSQELHLEFPSNAQQLVNGAGGGGGNMPFNLFIEQQNLERLTIDKVRVSSLSNLKLGLKLEDYGGEQEWRVVKVNGLHLGRDENVVMDRAILGDISDPRFNLVRDQTSVKLQHLHLQSLQLNETSEGLEEQQDQNQLLDDIAADGDHSVFKAVKSYLSWIVSSSAPSATSTPSLPYNLVVNQTASTAVGVGAAPLPPADAPAGRRISDFGPVDSAVLPWTTVYGAGDACGGLLPEAVPRTHQVVVMRRGGCSFNDKLANIPAYAPSAAALQLVVMVSDADGGGSSSGSGGGDDGGLGAWGEDGEAPADRPLLDRAQTTPSGIPRHNPIAMVMVGGGRLAYQWLVSADRVGFARRFYIESSGIRVGNIIVDDGEAGAV